MPMLSTMVPSSSGGMRRRIAFWIVRELAGALLDAGADLGAHVHQDLPGIDGGEEVAAEKGHQQEGCRHEADEADNKDGAVSQAPLPAGRDS